MIKYERLEFQPYFRELADRMALKDWAIEVEAESTGTDDDLATISRCKGRKNARIRLSEAFLRSGESDQRLNAVHELIHCHLSPVDFLVFELVGGKEGDLYRLQREYAVDAIADGWAPLLPLPSDILAKGSP
jgi:hypothetical protein